MRGHHVEQLLGARPGDLPYRQEPRAVLAGTGCDREPDRLQLYAAGAMGAANQLIRVTLAARTKIAGRQHIWLKEDTE
ncbi:hypothetical protein SPHINGO8AM_130204 [Sphingomonas sp. 8AM]|nr:hypothetical protein SPHINGO8AM_130204 [Sphingomonas sp. 8AM]